MAMSKNTKMAAAAAKEYFGNRWFERDSFNSFMCYKNNYRTSIETLLKHGICEELFEEAYDEETGEEISDYYYRFV